MLFRSILQPIILSFFTAYLKPFFPFLFHLPDFFLSPFFSSALPLFSVLGVAWVDGLDVVVGLGSRRGGGSWVLGLRSSVLGLGSWVLGLPISPWVGHGGLGVVASW